MPGQAGQCQPHKPPNPTSPPRNRHPAQPKAPPRAVVIPAHAGIQNGGQTGGADYRASFRRNPVERPSTRTGEHLSSPAQPKSSPRSHRHPRARGDPEWRTNREGIQTCFNPAKTGAEADGTPIQQCRARGMLAINPKSVPMCTAERHRCTNQTKPLTRPRTVGTCRRPSA